MSWRDEWDAQQRAIRDAEPRGSLIPAVTGEVVNFRLTEPLRCEDREFYSTWEGPHCNQLEPKP